MAYSQEWLDTSNARRIVLAEFTVNKIGVGSTTLYFSTGGFITTTSDAYYAPNIKGGMSFAESISLDGSISVTYGDVELHNPNGELDSYLDSSQYIWTNGTVKLYYGDKDWVASTVANVHTDFLTIFNGVIADIDSKDRNTINVKVRDKLQRLNEPITQNKLGTYGSWGGTNQTNQDEIKPLVFGEVFNIEPMLINPAALEYQINDGLTERIIETRDNGIPVLLGEATDASSGKFELAYALVGQLTASIQGMKMYVDYPSGAHFGSLVTGTYKNNIANIIGLIATQFGNPDTKIGLNELDLENLGAFATANTQAIGVYITQRENTLDICNQIANSIGAQLFFTRTGFLQLLRLGVPTTDTSVEITNVDMEFGTLRISQRSTVRAATKIGYAKNWKVQEGLVTSIPDAHKNSYATEWLTKTVSDSTVATNYKLTIDPEAKNTLLITAADADAEATRLNNYFKQVRTVYSFTGTSKLLSLKLGQPVTLKHPTRFGLSAGASGQVIGLTPDWLKGKIEVEVIV